MPENGEKDRSAPQEAYKHAESYDNKEDNQNNHEYEDKYGEEEYEDEDDWIERQAARSTLGGWRVRLAQFEELLGS
jgi:hypothetical protein